MATFLVAINKENGNYTAILEDQKIQETSIMALEAKAQDYYTNKYGEGAIVNVMMA